MRGIVYWTSGHIWPQPEGGRYHESTVIEYEALKIRPPSIYSYSSRGEGGNVPSDVM